MSKIYEALRQAELDRSKTDTAESDSETSRQATSQAVLEEALGPTHMPAFSNTGRALAALPPVSRANGGKTSVAPPVDSRIALAGAADEELELSTLPSQKHPEREER